MVSPMTPVVRWGDGPKRAFQRRHAGLIVEGTEHARLFLALWKSAKRMQHPQAYADLRVALGTGDELWNDSADALSSVADALEPGVTHASQDSPLRGFAARTALVRANVRARRSAAQKRWWHDPAQGAARRCAFATRMSSSLSDPSQ